MKTLFPEQEHSRKILLSALRRHRAALCSSEMGTGKTVTAVELAREFCSTPPLVLCPKSTIPGWQRTFAEQGVPVREIINYEKIKTGKHPDLSKKGKSLFKWNLPAGTLIIVDECHQCKAQASQNASMLLAAKSQGYPVLMLSATPFENPTEMKAIGYALGLHNGTGFYKWAQLNGCNVNRWRALEFDPGEIDKLEVLNRLIYPDRGHRLTREDLGAHFAECAIDWTPMDFGDSGAINKLLAAVGPQLLALAERREQDGEDPVALVEILRARQKVELLKVPAIAEMIADARAGGMSVFVALNFNASIDALAEMVRPYYLLSEVRGGQSAAERERAIQEFQSNRVRVCLANLAAGGVGINLHDEHGGHPRLALINPSYDAKTLWQALGRVDRVGTQTAVIQRVLTAADSIEETILGALKKKIANMSCVHAAPDLELHQIATQQAALTPEIVPPTAPAPDMGIPISPVTGPADHAQFSPSQLKYFKSCPGYLPQSGDSEASRKGTRIHAALETDDDSGLNDEHERYIAGQCRVAVGHIYKLHRFHTAVGVREFKEVRLSIRCQKESTYGTCDLLYICGNKGVAIDYKTGRGAVDDADQNMQARAYSLGVLQKHPELDTMDFYFVIPQRDEVLHATFTRRDIPVLEVEMEQIIRRARQAHTTWATGEVPLDMLHVDESVCRFCGNIERCPKIGSVAVEIVRRYAPEIQLPANVHGSNTEDPAALASMLKLVPILTKWAEGVKKQARFLAVTQGVPLPGYSVETRSGSRVITSASAAWECLEGFDIPIEKFLDSVGSVSVTEYENLVSSKAPRGDKKRTVERVMSNLYAKGGIRQGDDVQILSADS